MDLDLGQVHCIYKRIFFSKVEQVVTSEVNKNFLDFHAIFIHAKVSIYESQVSMIIVLNQKHNTNLLYLATSYKYHFCL